MMKDYDGPRISGIWGYNDPKWWTHFASPLIWISILIFSIGVIFRWW